MLPIFQTNNILYAWQHGVLMKVLVTGCKGQLGSTLMDLWSGRLQGDSTPGLSMKETSVHAHEVIGLDIRGTDDEIVVHDITKPLYPYPDARLENLDCIVHCAAQISVASSMDDPTMDSMTNIAGTVNLLELARRTGVRKFINISSAAIFGNPEFLPIDESHPTKPLSPYGLSKLSAEKYALLYGEMFHMEVVSIRPFNIFSERMEPDNPYAGVITIFIENLLKDEEIAVFGDGEQTRDFIYVEDVARFIDICTKDGVQGIFNCATGNRATLNELIDILAELTGKEPKVKYQEPRDGDIRHSYADITAAKRLGFEPKFSLKDGLARLL